MWPLELGLVPTIPAQCLHRGEGTSSRHRHRLGSFQPGNNSPAKSPFQQHQLGLPHAGELGVDGESPTETPQGQRHPMV